MPGMILNTTFLLDEVRHPGRRPQSGFIAECLRTPLQRSRQALQLWGPESWLAAGPARPLQAAASLALQLPSPAAHRLPMHAHLSGNLRLAQTLGQQSRRPPATSFQNYKVPSYSGWISHAERLAQMAKYVTILYDLNRWPSLWALEGDHSVPVIHQSSFLADWLWLLIRRRASGRFLPSISALANLDLRSSREIGRGSGDGLQTLFDPLKYCLLQQPA
jgi:hypothetical protein